MKIENVSVEFISFDAQDIITTSPVPSHLYLQGTELNALNSYGTMGGYIGDKVVYAYGDYFAGPTYTDSLFYNVDDTKGTLVDNGNNVWIINKFIVGESVSETTDADIVGFNPVVEFLISYQQ